MDCNTASEDEQQQPAPISQKRREERSGDVSAASSSARTTHAGCFCISSVQGPFPVTFMPRITIPTTSRAFTPVSAPVIPAPPPPPPGLLGGLGGLGHHHHHHSQRRHLREDLPSSSSFLSANDEPLLPLKTTTLPTPTHSSSGGRSLLVASIPAGTPSIFPNIPIDTFVPATGGPFPVVLFAGGSGVRHHHARPLSLCRCASSRAAFSATRLSGPLLLSCC